MCHFKAIFPVHLDGKLVTTVGQSFMYNIQNCRGMIINPINVQFRCVKSNMSLISLLKLYFNFYTNLMGGGGGRFNVFI